MSDGADDANFELLLEYLRRSRGFDFTGYKRASLARRVRKRMHAVGVPAYADYMDFLEVHPEEFAGLFDTILINVTAFFRDPGAWETIAEQVIPRLMATKRPDDPIRLWSAGCASGEEAYTLAMVMAEALGPDEVRERVKIYATDVDEEALTRARHAAFGPKAAQTVPPELLEKYFEPREGLYIFQKDLRRSVIFGRHDLIQDAPISRIDLLACRNTLMYLNTETQGRILERFHFALNDGGFLFLGKAETLLTYNTAFIPVDLKRRVFAKVAGGSLRGRLAAMVRAGLDDAAGRMGGHARARDAAFEAAPVAQLVVDAGGMLALASERARTIFNIPTADVGRPLQDLPISYRPAELRSCIERASATLAPAIVRDVEWSTGPGESSVFEVHVVPLFDPGGNPLGTLISFLDATAARRMAGEHERSTRELEAAYEELQSTNEELETTNEELQSTNEELETTTEELQSTNEELETMNEELQSTNEELETVNEELSERGEQLRVLNTFLELILTSFRGGVVVVDPGFLVQTWNRKAEDLWGLRFDEVQGKNMLGLDIGLPVERLKPLLLNSQSSDGGLQQGVLPAMNRRGKRISCRVTCTPMSVDGKLKGTIIFMEDDMASADGDGATSADGDGATRAVGSDGDGATRAVGSDGDGATRAVGSDGEAKDPTPIK